jgi:hypothetical protein
MNSFNSHYIALMALSLVLLSGCAKDVQKREIKREVRADKFVKLAGDRHAETCAIFKEEIAILETEKDEKNIKKMLARVVLSKKYDGWLESVGNFLFSALDSKKIPFHRYVRFVNSEISNLSSMQVALIKCKHGSTVAMIEKFDLLMKQLQQIITYVESHKEFRTEDRYITTLSR